jgi:hypothetical protein
MDSWGVPHQRVCAASWLQGRRWVFLAQGTAQLYTVGRIIGKVSALRDASEAARKVITLERQGYSLDAAPDEAPRAIERLPRLLTTL